MQPETVDEGTMGELSQYLEHPHEDKNIQLQKVQAMVTEKPHLLKQPNYKGGLPFHLALQNSAVSWETIIYLLQQWKVAAQIYLKDPCILPIAYVIQNWADYWRQNERVESDDQLLVELVKQLANAYPDGLTEKDYYGTTPMGHLLQPTIYWPPEVVQNLVEMALHPFDNVFVRQRVEEAFVMKSFARRADQRLIFTKTLEEVLDMSIEQQQDWLDSIKFKLADAIKRDMVLENEQTMITEFFEPRVAAEQNM